MLHVESMLPTYRPSFDGEIFGAIGDEPMSGRRNYSLPGARASFSGSDFARDRLPSFSAYPAPTSQPTRQRDRFSIAIPPDQIDPNTMANIYNEVDERPVKRVKMDAGEDSLVPLQLEADDLAKYYELIHPQFPILPDSSDSALAIIGKSASDLQHAIVTVISLLPNTANSQENGYKQKSGIKTVIDMVERLNKAMTGLDSAADILVFIWTTTIFVYHVEYAVDAYDCGPLPSSLLVRKNLDLLLLISNSTSVRQNSAVTAEKALALGIDLQVLEDAAARARSMAMLQAKLNLMATGKLIRQEDNTVFVGVEDVDAAHNLIPSAKFLAYATKSLAWTGALLIAGPDSSRRDIDLQRTFLASVADQLDHSALRSGVATTDSLYLQLEEFEKLLTARITLMPTPLSCLFPAAKLAEMLTTTSSTYSPLDVHLYTTCVFTFLEVLATPNSNAEWANPVAQTGLNSVRPILQQKAAEYAASRSAADKAFWGTYNGKEMVKKSWAEALSDHIDACEAINWINTSIADRHLNEYGKPDITANFQQLVNMGWLKILSYYARKMVRSEMEGDEADEAVAAAAVAAGGLEETAPAA